MSSARSDKALAHRITRKLDGVDVGPARVSPRRMPAGGDPSARTPAVVLKAEVPAFKRQGFLRRAIQATGRTNYLIRYGQGQKYKAQINGRIFFGTFSEVFTATAPFTLPHLDQCLQNP